MINEKNCFTCRYNGMITARCSLCMRKNKSTLLLWASTDNLTERTKTVEKLIVMKDNLMWGNDIARGKEAIKITSKSVRIENLAISTKNDYRKHMREFEKYKKFYDKHYSSK